MQNLFDLALRLFDGLRLDETFQKETDKRR